MTPPSNSFCFAPMFNHPPHKDEKGVVHASYDATGAFHPYMAAYEKLYRGGRDGFPRSEALAARVISLPFSADLDPTQQQQVVNALASATAGA